MPCACTILNKLLLLLDGFYSFALIKNPTVLLEQICFLDLADMSGGTQHRSTQSPPSEAREAQQEGNVGERLAAQRISFQNIRKSRSFAFHVFIAHVFTFVFIQTCSLISEKDFSEAVIKRYQ